MEPNLEEFIGKTGLIQLKYSLNPHFLTLGARKQMVQREAQYIVERIKRGMEQILYKVIEDGREYDFHNAGLRTWSDERPPYDHHIEGRMAVGLNNANDCAVGEYWLARVNSHWGDYWSEWRGPTFRYEGDYLWRRIA